MTDTVANDHKFCVTLLTISLSWPWIWACHDCSDQQNTVEGLGYSILSLVLKRTSSFYFLSWVLPTMPKEAQATTQKGQQEGILRHPGQQPQLNSQPTASINFVSPMSGAILEATPPAPVDILEATPPAPIDTRRSRDKLLHLLCPNCQIVINTWLLCFKPLSFEIVSYTTINHRNKNPLIVKKKEGKFKN